MAGGWDEGRLDIDAKHADLSNFICRRKINSRLLEVVPDFWKWGWVWWREQGDR